MPERVRRRERSSSEASVSQDPATPGSVTDVDDTGQYTVEMDRRHLRQRMRLSAHHVTFAYSVVGIYVFFLANGLAQERLWVWVCCHLSLSLPLPLPVP